MCALNKFYDELGLAKSRELYEKYMKPHTFQNGFSKVLQRNTFGL